jgi:predicted nucleic acid-binding protein
VPLLSSVIQVYEIYKVVRRDISEERAIEAVSALRATRIELLAESLALEAADIALEHGLAMADAIIFATAKKHEADIITADADFEGLPGVTLVR